MRQPVIHDAARVGTGGPRDGSEPGARIFVGATWLVMSSAAVVLVVRYGVEVPFWDDFALVPVLAGEKPLTVQWLWEQHNEHRIALSKLVLLGAYRLSGFDFRAGMFLSVAALGALAGGLIKVARGVRGAICYSDAFFPIVLLSWGLHADLLWSIQFTNVLPVALTSFLLLLIAARPSRPGLLRTILAAVLLGLLPFNGATGLAFVPPFCGWFLALAASHWRSREPGARRWALMVLALMTPAVAATLLYFRGYRSPSHHAIRGEITGALRTSIQFLGIGFGPSASVLWPWSGMVAVALFVSSLALVVQVLVKHPEERLRSLGILCFLGANGVLAAGVGWGRAAAGDLAGFQDRYVVISVPWLCCASLVWGLYGRTAARRLVPMCLLLAVSILLWPNTQIGLENAEAGLAQARALARDIRNGVPIYLILKRYTPFLYPSQDGLADLLRMLRRARIAPFAHLRENPPFREVRISPVPTSLIQATWDGETAQVTNVDPYLIYDLPEGRDVCGIRLRYSHTNRDGGPAHFKMSWSHDETADVPSSQRYGNWTLPTGDDRETTVWVGDRVKRLRIQPDNQVCRFRVLDLVLLVLESPESYR
jgi:hypothetical protein